jgi:3-phosphoshikimate 1-carboxyvinyltransferase
MTEGERYVVSRLSPLRGSVTVPGDKSVTHRAVLLAALAAGRSEVSGANLGADVLSTVRIVRQLGCRCDVVPAIGQIVVDGPGFSRLEEPNDVLNAGNSGTTLRIMLGIASSLDGAFTFSGDASLRSRPMLRVVDPLRRMGAAIDGRRNGALAPLTVRGRHLVAVDHRLEVASAQVKTALLLAGLRAAGVTSVTEPAISRDHTERMLPAAGISIERIQRTVTIEGGQVPQAADWRVPGDISAALFPIVAALLVPGSDITVEGVGLNPTRTTALDILRRMGADIEVRLESEEGAEPSGSVRARHSELTATTIEGGEVPGLIDELPAIAVAASLARGETVVKDATELRVKESDRIETIVSGLRSLGVAASSTPDGFVVHGTGRLGSGEVESRGDHRIAMAFAVAGLAADGPVGILNWECVETSFPNFGDVLAGLTSGERSSGRHAPANSS